MPSAMKISDHVYYPALGSNERTHTLHHVELKSLDRIERRELTYKGRCFTCGAMAEDHDRTFRNVKRSN